MPANQIALIRSRTLYLVDELRQSLSALEAAIKEQAGEENEQGSSDASTNTNGPK
jgi:hypothetical protein